jgi:NADH dehydrogenase FAD-containing subunit
VSASTGESGGRIVVAGAGYAALHVALRLTAKLRNNPVVELTLVDRHDYHQALTELPRVAAGLKTSPSLAWPSAPCRCTRPPMPSGCGPRPGA